MGEGGGCGRECSMPGNKETMRYTVILTIQGLELGLYRVRINDYEGRVSCSMRTNTSPSFGSANTDVPHLCMVSRFVSHRIFYGVGLKDNFW